MTKIGIYVLIPLVIILLLIAYTAFHLMGV